MVTSTNSSSSVTPQPLSLSDSSLFKSQGYINGKWVDAKSSKTFEVHNPANGALIGRVPEMGTVEETEEAIKVAKTAFNEWRNTSPKVRMPFRLVRRGDDIDVMRS
jgi:succinate-semialdehyde dehydrogenase/glutarate-semialdehyde dehydrogenase